VDTTDIHNDLVSPLFLLKTRK